MDYLRDFTSFNENNNQDELIKVLVKNSIENNNLENLEELERYYNINLYPDYIDITIINDLVTFNKNKVIEFLIKHYNMSSLFRKDYIKSQIIEKGKFDIVETLIQYNYFNPDHITELDLSDKYYIGTEGLFDKIAVFKNLEKLYIENINIDSLEPLRNLTKLKELNFNKNNVKSLEPLKKLTNLEILVGNNNMINSLDGIENCYDLNELQMNNNEIEDLLPLKNLEKLSFLLINNNSLYSLKGVEQCSNLEEFDFSNCEVSSLEPVKDLINIKTIEATENDITSLEYLSELNKLHRLIITIKEEFYSYNDLKGIENLENLSSIYIEFDDGSVGSDPKTFYIFNNPEEVNELQKEIKDALND